jgi:hypothetical protein
LAGLSVLLVVSLCMFGWDGYRAYITFIANESVTSNSLGTLAEPDLHGQLLKLAVGDKMAARVALGAFAIVLAGCLYLGSRFRNSKDWAIIQLLTAVPLSLLFALHVHNYDLLLLIPALVAVTKSPALLSPVRCWKLLPLLLLLELPFYVGWHYYYILHGSPINPIFWGLMVYEVMILYCLLAGAAQPKSDA